MVHDDDTGQREFGRIPEKDRPGRMESDRPGRAVQPRKEVIEAVAKIIKKHPNYVERPKVILRDVPKELTEILLKDFGPVLLPEVRAALQVVSVPPKRGSR